MKKRIMILGASILQLPAIQQARKMGHYVVAVDMNPDAVGFTELGIEKEIVSTIDIPKVLEAAKRHKIDGIMTLASDMPVRTVATVAKELGLVGISEEAALNATNKAYMRFALLKHGVPIPTFCVVSSRNEYSRAINEFSVPFIVKPADNSGSRGVMKISDRRDQKTIYEAYDYSRTFSRTGDVVVEEYMDGPEVSVETLTVNGECRVVQITDKVTTGAPHFVEMGHSQPSRLNHDTKQKIIDVTKAANRAVGITEGPSHTEIIITSEGPKVVELGARLGGDCIATHLVPLSTGVDMVGACIAIALGEKPDISIKHAKASAIRYFSPQEGIIRTISGVDEALRMDGVKQISFVHGVGETVGEIDCSSARVGFVIAQADTAEEAIDRCENVMQKVQICVEKET